MLKSTFARCGAFLCGAFLIFVGSLQASGWKEVPQAHWDLTEVPGSPGAPAVVLLDQGILRIDDKAISSSFEIYSRIKILTEEGREFGTLSIAEDRFRRMRDLEARTLLPDGRIIEMDKDAKFEKKYSSYFNYTINTVALSAVEPGAIVEWRYRVYFDSILHADPWYFQSSLPTLRSEIICEYPGSFGFSEVKLSPLGYPIEHTTERGPKAQRAVYSMSNVPAVPDEPFRFPFEDLSAWVLFLPQTQIISGQNYQWLTSWERAAEIMEGNSDVGYVRARRKSGDGRSKVKALIAGLQGDEQKARAIYRFVRDEIDSYDWSGVSVGKRTGDQVLKDGGGDSADKAVLLQTMLKAAKIDSKIGWIRARDEGTTHQNVPTPFQFTDVVTVAQIGGKQVFLDPTGSSLPFGTLRPYLENLPCLLVGGKEPEWVTTPYLPIDGNHRQATIRWRVSPEGALSATGDLLFTGHWGRSAAASGKSEDSPEDHWQEWLEGRFSGFDVSEVKCTETEEQMQVAVSWRLQQREEEMLGDEVSLNLAAPVGLTKNTFSLPPGKRSTPVLLSHASSSTVEVHVEWPEGWELDGQPRLKQLANGAGTLSTALRAAEGGQGLVASRTLALAKREFMGGGAYGELHQLWSAAAANDAETLVLVRQ